MITLKLVSLYNYLLRYHVREGYRSKYHFEVLTSEVLHNKLRNMFGINFKYCSSSRQTKENDVASVILPQKALEDNTVYEP